MRMEEGENIAQYASKIKEVLSAIRSFSSHLDDETVLRKFEEHFSVSMLLEY